MTHIERMINLSIKEAYLKQAEQIEVKLLSFDHLRYVNNFSFKRDQLYKIISTEEIPDEESFTLIFFEKLKNGYLQPATYENDKLSCFVRFKRDATVNINFYQKVGFFNLNFIQ